MIHSGSRGLGNDVLNIHCQKFGNKGIDINKNKEEFDKYMNLHNNALKWAKKKSYDYCKTILVRY